MERTLLLVKPDAFPHAKSIIALLESRGFFVLKAQETHFTRERAVEYHFESMGTPTFNDKVAFVCSGPCYAAVVCKVRAVAELRTIVGPYDPEVARQTQPNTLRALYGLDNLRNAVNCSASVEVALREISCLFPSAPLHVLPSEEYLREAILPGLVEALAELSAPNNLPSDPYAALERWLVSNRPMSEGVYAHSVLTGHVLKYDSLKPKLAPVPGIEAVSNFRKVKGPAPLYSMAQCPVAAREPLVAKLFEAGHSSVTFVNVREEPVLYIRGHSCTIRNAAALDRHIEHLANVEAHELVRIERRLAADVLAEAFRNKGNFTVVDQSNKETVVEGLQRDDILTLSEAHHNLQAKYPNVNFMRIPVTAGSIPSDTDVVDIVELVKSVPAGGCVVFECSSGGGRSTLVLTMAVVVWRILHATPTELNMWMRRGTSGAAAHDDVLNDSIVLNSKSDGDFAVVKQLLATVGHGATLKRFVDDCIDLTDDVISLRKCIASFLEDSERGGGGPEQIKALREASRYLRSYCRLMVLGAYGVECAPEFNASFKDWHRQHWNLQRPLKKLSFD